MMTADDIGAGSRTLSHHRGATTHSVFQGMVLGENAGNLLR